MNKKIVIIIGILLTLLIGGVIYSKQKTNKNSNTKSENVTSNVFTSIKDVLSKNITLICDFKDETGISTKSYIKNGAVRVSSSGTTTQASEIIMKDKKMYMWDTKTKQGFVYDIPDPDNKVGTTVDQVDQSESYLNLIDKYKDSCKVATVEDSYFEAPLDVKYQDMSKLLEDLKKQTPQVPQGN